MGPQHDVHDALERGRSPVQAEGKGPVLPVPIGVLKAVLGLAVLERGTCQYPLVKSRVEIYRALPRRSRSSSTRGIG